METTNVTRLEIIDHTICKVCSGSGWIRGRDTSHDERVTCPRCLTNGMKGREVIFWDVTKQIELSLQDDGRTLKIFISERDSEENTSNQ